MTKSKPEDQHTLVDLSQHLGVSYKQLTEWERRRTKTGFPEPSFTLGRHKLFDLDEVILWYELWKKVTNRLGRNLRGPRS